VKEHPILFSAPMVRALLAYTKTQTRRVVKPQPYYDRRFINDGLVLHKKDQDTTTSIHSPLIATHCPYGQPGDRLWVRESGWERPERTAKMMREGADTWPRFAYAADGYSDQDRADFKAWGFKPRPSIHMPRWASRILLEIVSVRVERLQEISEADALAEGVTRQMRSQLGWAAEESEETFNARQARSTYGLLWDSINGNGSWASNPCVWVVEFKRATQ
jgi:hypothetical protein